MIHKSLSQNKSALVQGTACWQQGGNQVAKIMMISSNGNISALLALCEGNPPGRVASDAEL